MNLAKIHIRKRRQSPEDDVFVLILYVGHTQTASNYMVPIAYGFIFPVIL